MQEVTTLTGMVIRSEPYGEYDRRVVLLTMQQGKITAFAKGARRQNSKLMAGTGLFAFGEFKLYPGRNAYTMVDADISNYFEKLMQDFEGAYYGMYFLEIADYYTRENNDESMMLKLLYVSCLALTHMEFEHELVRAVYEIKAIAVNGEFPGIPKKNTLDPDTIYTIEYILSANVTKLFSFRVNEKVLKELSNLAKQYCRHCIDKQFRSLSILETLK